MDNVDILIIGAGVIGLAIAAELSTCLTQSSASIVVLERYETFGQGISSRNSEIIHAGLYYPENSLKALLCVEGKNMLYNFCQKWNIPYRRVGKLIIARNENEMSLLQSLIVQGYSNGVFDLNIIDRKELSKLEPNIKAGEQYYRLLQGL